jgi:hypothetical protein
MMLLLTLLMVAASTAIAEPPKTIEMKQEGVTVRLSNISVVTGTASSDPLGGPPEKVVPLNPKELLHPESPVWVQFDYETDFKKSDVPNSLQSLLVAIHLIPEKHWGYQPARLNDAKGKGWIRVFPHRPADRVVEIDDSLQFVAYGTTNKGQQKQIVSKETETVTIRFRRDGQVTLSLTQYQEIQAGLRRLADLERKVKQLENKSE